MPLIPLPSTSYPVDTNLIYEIIRGINVLSDGVSRSSGIANLNGKTATNAVQTITKNINVVNNQTIKSGDVIYFTCNYGQSFKDIPIVVATPVVSGSNIVTRSLSIVLTSVETGKTTGFIRFGEAGVTTVNLNIIAIGESSTYKR